MNQSFSHILTTTFNHAYFEEGLFRSLELSYAEDTLRLMKDLEIIIKPFRGGFHLLTSNPELLALNDDSKPLQLFLNCNDPYYINYTLLPGYSPSNSLIYFNNLDAVKVDDSKLRLHSGGQVVKRDILRLSNGQFRINQFDPNKTYVFKHANNDPIPGHFIAKASPDADQIRISNMPQGVVRVFDGATIVDSVYYQPNTVWKKPLGTIEIFTKSLYDHYKNGSKVDYSVHFTNRKSIWKYFLISKEYQKFNDLTIINSAREQIFELDNEDAEALVLTSKYKLPLAEHPSDTLQLVNNFIPGQRSETVILNHLVNASPEQLYHNNEAADGTVYSHIYL